MDDVKASDVEAVGTPTTPAESGAALTPMSKTEVRELRTIVTGRFDLLTAQLKERELEIKEAIKAQIEDEYADRRKQLKKELEKVVAVFEKYSTSMNALIDEAADQGLELAQKRQYYTEASAFERPSSGEEEFRYADFFVRKLKDEVDERYRKIAGEKLQATFRLGEIKWSLLEDLAAAQLQGSSAKAFLARIPTVDSLLPPPVLNGGVHLAEIEKGDD